MPASGPDHACANLLSWYEAIRTRSNPDPSLEDGLAALEPVFAAEESNTLGQAIRIGRPIKAALS